MVGADSLHRLASAPAGGPFDRDESGIRRAARRSTATTTADRRPRRRRPGGRLPGLRRRAAGRVRATRSARTHYAGPLGAATGADRLQIRLYDLLAHGWDLATATGQPIELPEDAAEQALAFVRTQLTDNARPGRFDPVQLVADDAPAIERLVAFLGRPVDEYR